MFALLASCALALLLPSSAHARRVRPLFEPTDLELEAPGIVELDLQVGAARSEDGPFRVVVPDFEVDVGILEFLEFDLDGAYAIEGPDSGPFRLDHPAPDSLWAALKVGLYDSNDPGDESSIALGMQFGPKLPVPTVHGIGAEGLLLFATKYKRLEAVWNAGGFMDPAPSGDAARPRGLEFGVDINLDLDEAGTFAADGGGSFVRFWSHDRDQLLLTAGMTWSPTDMLDLSIVGFMGFLPGGDRYGVLLGIAPKLRLYRPPQAPKGR